MSLSRDRLRGLSHIPTAEVLRSVNTLTISFPIKRQLPRDRKTNPQFRNEVYRISRRRSSLYLQALRTQGGYTSNRVNFRAFFSASTLHLPLTTLHTPHSAPPFPTCECGEQGDFSNVVQLSLLLINPSSRQLSYSCSPIPLLSCEKTLTSSATLT